MRHMRTAFTAGLAVLLLTACGKKDEAPPSEAPVAEEAAPIEAAPVEAPPAGTTPPGPPPDENWGRAPSPAGPDVTAETALTSP